MGCDVQLYLGERLRFLPLLFAYVQRPQETPVEGRMRLFRIQMTVLIEEDLGERELEFLIVAAPGDQSRQIQPAHPDVPVVLNSERPYTLLVSIPLPEPLQKRVHQRRVSNNLSL